MTVRELLSRIGSDELTLWAAEYRIAPFGDLREDIRTAMTCCAIISAAGGKPEIEDYLPFCKTEQSLDDMLEWAEEHAKHRQPIDTPDRADGSVRGRDVGGEERADIILKPRQ